MRRLKVALIVKGSPASLAREHRNMGQFSYPVPEFEWSLFAPNAREAFHTEWVKSRGYDFIFHEDGGNYGEYFGKHVPVVYYSIDSTITDSHYQTRRQQAQMADIVLVDHDRLERFTFKGSKTFRFNHCVNDHVFKPAPEKLNDVAYHCSARDIVPGGEGRRQLRITLHDITRLLGYTYRSGTRDILAYGQSIAESCIHVNWPRMPTNRPHRVMDTLACNTCLLTGPFQTVSDAGIVEDHDYATFESHTDLAAKIDWLLREPQNFTSIAQRGYDTVMQKHTWAVRARELRELVYREFGL